jgi:hypothetical protein
MTDEERDALIHKVALTTILDESKKWISRFRWTITASIFTALGFLGYGVYLLFEILGGANPALAVMALAIALGVAGAFRLGKRASNNLRGLIEAMEVLKKENKIAEWITK